MSSFICEFCGKEIIDTENGYITGCEHYPVEEKSQQLDPKMEALAIILSDDDIGDEKYFDSIETMEKKVNIKYSKEIYLEGNKGGDYIKLRKLDNNRLYLEVGHCCVIIIRCVIPVEALTGFLGGVTFKTNKGFLGTIEQYLPWDTEYNKEIIEKCKYV